MDRPACIDLPALPLQLLLREHPAWRRHPAVVVDEDRPQGKILWVNERARAVRILPGMRYAAGLSLAGGLRAAEVAERTIQEAIENLAGRLRRHTPGVEPSRDEPGVFWLDASGLDRLHESLDSWARGLLADLQRVGVHGNVAVGFSRFGSYALARSAVLREGSGRAAAVRVLRDPEEERGAVRRVLINRLAFQPEARDTLHKLGVRTLGEFMDLPTEGVVKRFGRELLRLHRLARGALLPPLQTDRPLPPAVKQLHLDHGETDVGRLLVGVEGLLQTILEMLADRGHVATSLQLDLRYEGGGGVTQELRPAEPTLDREQWMQLLRLRLEANRLRDGVVRVTLQMASAPATRGQLDLFARPRRDLAAADRALARLRAELGDGAVVRARLQEGHLPEARFRWEELQHVSEPQPGEIDGDIMVRRIYRRPVPLPPRERHEPDGWMLRGLEQGPVVRVLGPYVISGGWWNRSVHREYHFAETQRGEVLWVYYDRVRRRWFLQGRVE